MYRSFRVSSVRSSARRLSGLVGWTLWLVVVVTSLLCLSGSGWADGALDAQVRALVEQAQASYQKRNLTDALEKLETARALKPLPRILLNIGKIQRELGRDAEAVISYEAYLAQEKDVLPNGGEDIRDYLNRIRHLPKSTEPPTPPASSAGTDTTPVTSVKSLRPPEVPSALVAAPRAQETSSRRRWWPFAVGAPLVLGGTVMVGFGINALAIDGECASSRCDRVYGTKAIGASLLGAGLGVTIAGGLLMTILGRPARRLSAVPTELRGRNLAMAIVR